MMISLYLKLLLVVASVSSTSLCPELTTVSGGCGLCDEDFKYFATLEGVSETLPVGELIPNSTFETFNISTFTIEIETVSYLQDHATNHLTNLPEQFFVPELLPGPGPGLQFLQFHLSTDLSEYMRNATTPIIEFTYKLECQDTTSREGTLLLDIIDENNIAPVFHFVNMKDQGATPKYFIDWLQYEDDPENFIYLITRRPETILDGDYLPQNGLVELKECLIDDEYECGLLVDVILSRTNSEAVTGSLYNLEFELVPEFDDFLSEHYTNASSLMLRLVVTDGVTETAKDVAFEFVGRAPYDGGSANGGESGGLGLQLILGIAGGGTLIVILIGLLAYAYRRVYIHKKLTEGLTKEDIEEFRNGVRSATGLSSNSTSSRWSRPRESIIANAPVFAKPYNNQYEIPRENLKIDETTVLGRGNFCIVMKGYVTTADGRRLPAAVKKVKEHQGVYFRSLLTELKILSEMGRHQNLVSVVAACTQNLDQGELLVAVELCTNGNFRNYLKDRRAFYEDLLIDGRVAIRRNSLQSVQSGSTVRSTYYQTMTTLDLIQWAFQIANGMEFIASKNVIHGDLAARNILLDDNRCAKIADFGLSMRLIDYSNYNYKIKSACQQLPWKYMAPESLKDLHFSYKTDVWTFGVLLWEIFTLGQKPFSTQNFSEGFVQKLENGLRLDRPKYAPIEIRELMQDCWAFDPKKRPNFTEIKKRISCLLQIHRDYTELCENGPISRLSGQGYVPWLQVPRFVFPGSEGQQQSYSFGFGHRRSNEYGQYGVIHRVSTHERGSGPRRPPVAERPNDGFLY